MPKTTNFGLTNFTKQKKKPRNTTKCHTKKKFRNITVGAVFGAQAQQVSGSSPKVLRQ